MNVVPVSFVLLSSLFTFIACWPFPTVPCPEDANEKWTYRGKKGPEYWENNYPKCAGKEQSGIDIRDENVEHDENLEKLNLNNYDRPVTNATIVNNGHTTQITPNDGVQRTINIGGAEYNLLQFHFHWGSNYAKGSEHKLNGVSYAIEIHFVHAASDGKLAVVGVIGQEQDENNPALQVVVGSLSDVRYKGQQSVLKSDINLNEFFPSNPPSYYRYEGSLTTPPCSEGVTWTVVKDLLPVGRRQLAKFRTLSSAEEGSSQINCPLSNNYRPIQPLNDRTVYSSK